tara:strand:- start:40 stop:603 length:564 start_codon:yes stop_codon:yes gene_type:complete
VDSEEAVATPVYAADNLSYLPKVVIPFNSKLSTVSWNFDPPITAQFTIQVTVYLFNSTTTVSGHSIPNNCYALAFEIPKSANVPISAGYIQTSTYSSGSTGTDNLHAILTSNGTSIIAWNGTKAFDGSAALDTSVTVHPSLSTDLNSSTVTNRRNNVAVSIAQVGELTVLPEYEGNIAIGLGWERID